MTPTKLLIGQILVVFAIVAFGLWAATQWAAAMLATSRNWGRRGSRFESFHSTGTGHVVRLIQTISWTRSLSLSHLRSGRSLPRTPTQLTPRSSGAKLKTGSAPGSLHHRGWSLEIRGLHRRDYRQILCAASLPNAKREGGIARHLLRRVHQVYVFANGRRLSGALRSPTANQLLQQARRVCAARDGELEPRYRESGANGGAV